ncbi:MAG: DnaJ domain-containing protein [Alphaproteobacteria bacterium]|nr:DnaJ domain-containing protein [Alphaproteobacteria bacterium]
MRKNTKRQSKYYAPQNEHQEHACDHPGCHEAGEYRAPKDRSLKNYYWFCLKHVQEYNNKWNYYDGLDEYEDQMQDKRRRHFRFGAKVKYNFGFDSNGNFEFYDSYTPDYSIISEARFTKEERICLKFLEIEVSELDINTLKKQYKKMVKKYHPDLNQGDKNAEENFKIISTAYKSLLSKLS